MLFLSYSGIETSSFMLVRNEETSLWDSSHEKHRSKCIIEAHHLLMYEWVYQTLNQRLRRCDVQQTRIELYSIGHIHLWKAPIWKLSSGPQNLKSTTSEGTMCNKTVWFKIGHGKTSHSNMESASLSRATHRWLGQSDCHSIFWGYTSSLHLNLSTDSCDSSSLRGVSLQG